MLILILVGSYVALLGNYVLCIQASNFSSFTSTTLRRYHLQDELAKYDN